MSEQSCYFFVCIEYLCMVFAQRGVDMSSLNTDLDISYIFKNLIITLKIISDDSAC